MTQYPNTTDLDLEPDSGLSISLRAQLSPTSACEHHAHPQPITELI